MGICCFCCQSKKVVYREALKKIYEITRQFKLNGEGNVDSSQINQKKLQEHVTKESKPILDYLENNQRALKDIAKAVYFKAKHSKNTVDHLLSLYILDKILPAIKGFNYDRRFLNKLMKNKKRKKKKYNQPDFLQLLLNKNMQQNFISFENKFLSMIKYLLTLKNKNKMLVFHAVIKTITIYGNSIPAEANNRLPKSNQKQIIARILEESNLMVKTLRSKEDFENCLNVMKGIKGLTSSRNSKIIEEVKIKLIDLVIMVLVDSSKKTQSIEVVEMKDEIQEKCLNIIEDIIFADLSIFDYDTTFLYILKKFIGFKWKYRKLHEKILLKFSGAMKESKNRNKIEGIIVEDLVELILKDEIKITADNHVLEEFQDFKVQTSSEADAKEIVGTLQYLVLEASEYFLSFYYTQILVKALSGKHFDSRTNSGLIVNINNCFRTLAVQLQDKSPATTSQFLEFLYDEFLKNSLLNDDTTQQRSVSYLENCNAMFKLLQANQNKFGLTNKLGDIFEENIKQIISRTKNIKNLNLILMNFCKLIQLKSSPVDCDEIEYVPLQSEFTLNLLSSVYLANDFMVKKNSFFDEKQSVYLVKITFCIFNSVIWRSNLIEVKYIVTFINKIKTSIIDEHRKDKKVGWLMNLYEIFWLYSLYLFSKKWEFEELSDLISGNDKSLTSENAKKLLLMLKDEDFEEFTLRNKVFLLKEGKTKAKKDISSQSVVNSIKKFFKNFNIEEEKFAMSFQNFENKDTKPELIQITSREDIRLLNETYTSRDNFSELPDDVSIDDIEFQINNFKEIKANERDFLNKN